MALPTMAEGFTRSTFVEWCRGVDEGPYSSISAGERITFHNPELLVTNTAAAALTDRVQVIMNLTVLPLHSTAMLAKQLATLDVLAGGRLVVGVGVGGREQDYRAVDASFSGRHARLDEGVSELRRLWRGGPAYEGGSRWARLPVQPGGPPVWAGSLGPKSMARAAGWADGVTGFSIGASRDEMAATNALALQAWERAGRADRPRLVNGSFFLLAGSGADERAPAVRLRLPGRLRCAGRTGPGRPGPAQLTGPALPGRRRRRSGRMRRVHPGAGHGGPRVPRTGHCHPAGVSGWGEPKPSPLEPEAPPSGPALPGPRPTGRDPAMATPTAGGQTGTMDPVVRRLRPDETGAFRRSVMVPFLEPLVGDPEQVADHELWEAKIEPDRAWVVDTGGRFTGNACIYSLDVTLPAPPEGPCPTAPMAGRQRGRGPPHPPSARLPAPADDGHARRRPAAGRGDRRPRGVGVDHLRPVRVRHGRGADRGGHRQPGLGVRRPGLAARPGTGGPGRGRTATARSVRPPPAHPGRGDRPQPGLLGPTPGRPAAQAGRGRRPLPCRVRRRVRALPRPVRRQRLPCRAGPRHDRGAPRDHPRGRGGPVALRPRPGSGGSGHRPAPTRGRTGPLAPGRPPAAADGRHRGPSVRADPRHRRRSSRPAATRERAGWCWTSCRPSASDGAADPAPGRWVLEAGPEGATCRRAGPGEDPELRLGLPALGSLYLGGTSASLLAAGGRIEELRPGRLVAADALLTTRPAPRSGTEF